MTRKEILLTSEGFLELEKELNELKTVKRVSIIQDIKEARAQGDLSENADYAVARDAQAQVESRIAELEYMIENAKIIEKKGKSNEVEMGSSVTIRYVEDKEEEVYIIVGSMEADPFVNKISNESPIGIAIMGKKAGDVISVESPTGSYKIEIVKIA